MTPEWPKPDWECPGARLYCGDAAAVLPTLPAASVQCVVTSPPYWGLRDYGVAGQLGLEPTPEEYVAKLVAVFREVRRVLRGDGTVWINMGDSYCSQPAGNIAPSGFSQTRPSRRKHGVGPETVDLPGKRFDDLKSKDLCGIPWRVAFALQADGWWLRQDIIWHKPNPMPESVTDRCTKAHEYIFLLAKSAKYHCDMEAVKEADGDTHSRGTKRTPPIERAGIGHKDWCWYMTRDNQITGRNRRSVWTVTTKPYPKAHFATYPPELIEPCVKAGCPTGGIVLDPYVGSGTTLQVALEQGCQAIGIELNRGYLPMIRERLGPVVARLDQERRQERFDFGGPARPDNREQ